MAGAEAGASVKIASNSIMRTGSSTARSPTLNCCSSIACFPFISTIVIDFLARAPTHGSSSIQYAMHCTIGSWQQRRQSSAVDTLKKREVKDGSEKLGTTAAKPSHDATLHATCLNRGFQNLLEFSVSKSTFREDHRLNVAPTQTSTLYSQP